MLAYYHADRLQYAVAGTPNRLEYDQGFFVKLGDGAADVKPIAHLYKTQVYALARGLGLPAEICRRPPTTDTYSLPQGRDDFYFALPYAAKDLCLWAHDHDVAAAEVAPHVGLRAEQVEWVLRDIERKRQTTAFAAAGGLSRSGPAMPGELLHRSNFASRSLAHLRYAAQAGGAMSPALTRQLREALRGRDLYVMYGATDAAGRLSYLPPARLARRR